MDEKEFVMEEKAEAMRDTGKAETAEDRRVITEDWIGVPPELMIEWLDSGKGWWTFELVYSAEMRDGRTLIITQSSEIGAAYAATASDFVALYKEVRDEFAERLEKTNGEIVPAWLTDDATPHNPWEPARGKAEFRALREAVGMSQRFLAEELGVKELSVKRWESPKTEKRFPPEEAWSLLDSVYRFQQERVSEEIEGHEQGEAVVLTFWNDEGIFQEYCSDVDTTASMVNATNLRIAERLLEKGVKVVWQFPVERWEIDELEASDELEAEYSEYFDVYGAMPYFKPFNSK